MMMMNYDEAKNEPSPHSSLLHWLCRSLLVAGHLLVPTATSSSSTRPTASTLTKACRNDIALWPIGPQHILYDKPSALSCDFNAFTWPTKDTSTLHTGNNFDRNLSSAPPTFPDHYLIYDWHLLQTLQCSLTDLCQIFFWINLGVIWGKKSTHNQPTLKEHFLSDDRSFTTLSSAQGIWPKGGQGTERDRVTEDKCSSCPLRSNDREIETTNNWNDSLLPTNKINHSRT